VNLVPDGEWRPAQTLGSNVLTAPKLAHRDRKLICYRRQGRMPQIELLPKRSFGLRKALRGSDGSGSYREKSYPNIPFKNLLYSLVRR
jgi:hypothetical protein